MGFLSPIGIPFSAFYKLTKGDHHVKDDIHPANRSKERLRSLG